MIYHKYGLTGPKRSFGTDERPVEVNPTCQQNLSTILGTIEPPKSTLRLGRV